MAPVEDDKAVYVGEAGNVLADGTPLIPGETICLVPAAEAATSEQWEAVKTGTTASPAPRNAPPSPTSPTPDSSASGTD